MTMLRPHQEYRLRETANRIARPIIVDHVDKQISRWRKAANELVFLQFCGRGYFLRFPDFEHMGEDVEA